MQFGNRALIIKPTYRCNFACNFCSTLGDSQITLDSDITIDFINRLARRQMLDVIVSGGEPLLMGTDYFKRILECPINSVGVQSNGEIAYKNIDQWLPILRDEKLSFGISFQLGEHRKNKRGEIFNRDLFYRYQNLFIERLGYPLFFIYVITDDNCGFAEIDEIVAISQELGTPFRISAALKSGLGGEVYIPQYRTIEIFNYLLENYPQESCQILPLKDFILSDSALSKCNYTPFCSLAMLSVEPNGDIYTCCGLGDRYAEPVGHISDDLYRLEENILKVDLSHQIREECIDCHNRLFCNSCYIRFLDLGGDSGAERDRYCLEMKRLHSNIARIRGLLGLEEDIIEIYKKSVKGRKYGKVIQKV